MLNTVASRHLLCKILYITSRETGKIVLSNCIYGQAGVLFDSKYTFQTILAVYLFLSLTHFSVNFSLGALIEKLQWFCFSVSLFIFGLGYFKTQVTINFATCDLTIKTMIKRFKNINSYLKLFRISICY